MVSRVVVRVARFSALWGGAGQIAGTTKVTALPDNVPVRRRVRLHDQKTGILVQEVWSDAATGAYLFRRLRMGLKYYVTAFDHTGAYGGVIETDITPEAMP